MNDPIDPELKLFMFIGRHLPAIPHITGIDNRILKPIYLRKKRSPVIVDVLDFRMILDPSECVDCNLLFHPHLYDREEIKYLRGNLYEGDVFLDIGANIGFYSLVASRIVGQAGRVVSIEADPQIYGQLVKNITINKTENIKAVNLGVSDKDEILMLGVCTIGNRGGSSFLREGNEKIEVQCRSLTDIVLSAGIEKIKAIKIDIEGFEYRVLKRFFDKASETLYPEIVIIEHIPMLDKDAGGSSIQLLVDNDYKEIERSGGNYIMRRKTKE